MAVMPEFLKGFIMYTPINRPTFTPAQSDLTITPACEWQPAHVSFRGAVTTEVDGNTFYYCSCPFSLEIHSSDRRDWMTEEEHYEACQDI